MTENLYTALAKANESIKNPAMDAKGAFGRYLTLDALLEGVRGPLAAQGLSVVQDVSGDDERVIVTTWLLHASGESLSCGPMYAPRGQQIQHTMGAVTYLRRMTLAALLGVSGDLDDDGTAHAQNVSNAPARRGNRPQNPPSEKAAKYLDTLMKKNGIVDGPEWEKSARLILGGTAEGWDGRTATLDATQVGFLIDALVKHGKEESEKVTRTQPTTPDPDDPWADVPLPMEPTR